MNLEWLLNENFTNLFIPFYIFTARILDVTIGTLRIMFVARGQKRIAPLLGFFEVFIWVTVLGSIMQNLTNPLSYIAYAGGFATGNLLGMKIEEHIAFGKVLIRIITPDYSKKLIDALIDSNFGVTYVQAKGGRTNVYLIYSIVERRELKNVVSIVKEINPKSFYSIEDVKTVNEGVFR